MRLLRQHHLPTVWGALLVLLMLGPALGPGYVLSYDMVWVPQLAMRSDFLGLGTAVPRAIPSDAVVAVLDSVVPAMLLQKLVLAGSLFFSAVGMRRLVGPSLVSQFTAVTLTVWNPFTVERLVIGHWTVLLGYGVLPWLLMAGVKWRRSGVMPPGLFLLLPLGSLSATAGLVSTCVVLAAGGGIRDRRDAARTLRLAVLSAAANAPWIVAGILHAGTARLAVPGPFALHGEGGMPALVAALSLGGIWNQEVVPASRHTFLAWVSLAFVALLVALGLRNWIRRFGGDVTRMTVLWVAGFGIAAAGAVAPHLISWVTAHVPGGGILRDGSRWLILCMPAWTASQAAGAEALSRALGARDRVVRVATGGLCALVPVVLLYDGAWAVGGRLHPAHFPHSWAQARRVVNDQGAVLVLPFSAYRAPAWNGGRTVLDPLGRYLAQNYLTNDSLLIGSRLLPGEDPRARAAAAVLRRGGPEEKAEALRELGVRFVATERDAGGPTPAVSGETVFSDPTLEVVRLSGPVGKSHPWSKRSLVALASAWGAFTGLVILGPVSLIIRRLRLRCGKSSTMYPPTRRM